MRRVIDGSARWRDGTSTVGYVPLVSSGSTGQFPSLPNVPIAFGLRAQGHLDTVERMLAEHRSWAEIGAAIGWDPETAERYYAMEKADE